MAAEGFLGVCAWVDFTVVVVFFAVSLIWGFTR